MNPLTSDLRRAIVTLLRERELSAGEIADALHRKRPGVSHHLSILLEHGLVHCRVENTYRFFKLDVERTLLAWDDYLLKLDELDDAA